MATNAAQVLNRQDSRQVVNTLKKIVNWNDPDVALSPFELGLPDDAVILGVAVDVVTAFNGTPTFVMGTVGAGYNNIVASSADANPGVAGYYQVTRGLGRGLTASGDVIPFTKVTYGGSPSTGQMVICITYEGGWRT